jgi:cobalt/nickel transport system permease protein
MAQIEDSIFNLKKLDTLAAQDTPLHRRDPRIKVLTTLVYIICIVSFDRYTVTGMLPYLLYPLFLLYLGNIPPGYILKKTALVAPFALFIALFNLFADRGEVITLLSFPVTRGMVSFVSIMLRFLLTVVTTLTLIAGTGFISLCYGLTKIGIPSVFAMQLLFLYRYIYVLIEESIKVIRAHHVRGFTNKIKMKTFGSITGHLLLRTIARAERIHTAMLSRGFHGKLYITRTLRITKLDLLFGLAWISLFIVFRFVDIPLLVGSLITGGNI